MRWKQSISLLILLWADLLPICQFCLFAPIVFSTMKHVKKLLFLLPMILLLHPWSTRRSPAVFLLLTKSHRHSFNLLCRHTQRYILFKGRLLYVFNCISLTPFKSDIFSMLFSCVFICVTNDERVTANGIEHNTRKLSFVLIENYWKSDPVEIDFLGFESCTSKYSWTGPNHATGQ